jgi:C4-dicarboxylate-binding protein DctP
MTLPPIPDKTVSTPITIINPDGEPMSLKSMCILLLCSILAGASASVMAEAQYKARIGHLEAPTQPRHWGLEQVAEKVKQVTNGEVEFELFPAAQLGNAREQVEATQFGSIEGTVQPAAFLGGFNPAISILDIPYLYPTDRDAAQKLRGGPFGQALVKSFDNRGLVALTIWPNGRKNLTSVKPIPDPAALEGQRFRVMDSKILIEQFAGVGASAIPLPFQELYTALQTGVVDGEENPLDTISTMKFYEVQKYLVISEHGAMEDVVLFNPAWWSALPDEHKEVIAKAFDEVRPLVEQRKEEAQAGALETIKTAGVEVRTANEAERATLREQMYPPARAAYLERAGDEGQKLIELYEAELQKLAQ